MHWAWPAAQQWGQELPLASHSPFQLALALLWGTQCQPNLWHTAPLCRHVWERVAFGGGGRYRRCVRENRMLERGHCWGHGWRHTCGRRCSVIKEMQTTGDPHQALVWPGHWEGLQTVQSKSKWSSSKDWKIKTRYLGVADTALHPWPSLSLRWRDWERMSSIHGETKGSWD